MLVERVAVAFLILTILSSSHQHDLPLVQHDKVAHLSTAGNKTRGRKFHYENSASLQDDRIHQQLRRNSEEERLKAESAGEGNGEAKASKSSAEEDDDDKKTLAQQVAEGKYGLIHTELFQTEPKRPGILTYKVNPEVPKDNVNNLGGLEAEEIWLAENHLLVLAGGGYAKERGHNWPPIDDYSAPRRQVKIPPNPKVPPPFPVQLTENGPIEIIRGVNGSYPRPLPFFPPSAAGDINGTGAFPFFPPPPPGFPPGNFTPPPGFPFPFPLPLPNGSIPELPPPPPGLPPFPPANWTNLIDEDDPSIYYPPPYDFYFPKDNSSYVPAGPLVPGIVLPPPPDFFSPYDNATKPTKTKLIVKGPVIKKVKYQPPKQYFETATKLPGYVDNTLTTTSTPRYIPKTSTSTEPPRPIKPSVQVIHDYPVTDDITNEVTPSQERNNKDDDWVPIPAPRPYYITGPAKQIQENMLVIKSTPKHEDDTQGYDYVVPIKPFKLPERTKEYPKDNSIPDFYNGNDDNHVYADDVLVKQYLPITRKPKAKSKATVAPAQSFHVPVRTGGKSLQATYYFYEDPHSEEDIGLVPPKPVIPLRPSPPQPNPTKASVEFYIPKEPIHIKSRPISVMNIYNPLPVMPVNPYDLRNPTTTTTTQRPSLLDYFYFNGDKNGGYNFMFPDGKSQLSPKSTSRPIFEYSYTAPGYKDETKKPNGMDFYFNSWPSTKTTSKPTDFLYSYDNSLSTTPASQPKQNEIFTTTTKPLPTPSPPQVLVQYETPTTTPRSLDRYNYARTSTQKPWRDISGRKPANSLSFTTPHPFYAFFTHNDESLVDDITKKYFTLFGQKLPRPGSGYETTTPIGEVHHSPKKQNTQYEFYSDETDYSKEKDNSGQISQESYSGQNSQENFNNFDQARPIQNNNNFGNTYANSQESYYEQDNYNVKGNKYRTGGASTEDPIYSKYNLNTNSFRTSTPKPKIRLNYQSSKRPSQLISVSNSFNIEEDNKHKNPSLEYDYDYDYDKQPAPSLQDDTRVNNYKKPYVKDYEAEWLPTLAQQYHKDTRGDNAANQFISYKLPGNGNGHFFFLTPQAVQLEELANAFLFPSNVENRNNFYSKRNTNRTRRRPEEATTQTRREKQSKKKST